MKKAALIAISLLCFVNFAWAEIDVKELIKKAESGNTEAQIKLGYMYLDGQGVPKNYAEAMKWAKRAAEKGVAKAQHMLGGIYSIGGPGVPINYVEAMKWYKKAADQGDTEAQIQVALMYYDGKGVSINKLEAMKWYRKAAEQGNSFAQFYLGRIYKEGQIVSQNYIKAYAWFNIAMASGFDMSRENLDELSHIMTVEQIAQAQKEAAELWEKINKSKK